MSNRHMTAAWGIAMPSTQKLVLVYACDRANDDGDAFFTVDTLSKQSGLSDRAVQKALTQLEAWNFIARVMRPGRSTVYRLSDPLTWEAPPAGNPRTTFTPEPDSPPNVVHPLEGDTPERGSPPNDVRPEPDSPAPEARSGAPEPGSPISSSIALLSPDCSSARAPGPPVEPKLPAPDLKAHVRAAMALIEAGVPAFLVNAQDPDLIELAAKLDLQEFRSAGAVAVKKRVANAYAYAMGMLRGRASELAERAAAARAPPASGNPAAVPPPNGTFKGKDYAGSSTPADRMSPAMRAVYEQQLAKRDGDAVVPDARPV